MKIFWTWNPIWLTWVENDQCYHFGLNWDIYFCRYRKPEAMAFIFDWCWQFGPLSVRKLVKVGAS